jgi:hypothetical protein
VTPFLPNVVEHKDSQAHHSADEDKQQAHTDIEPVIVKVLNSHEELADRMKKKGIDCEALPIGSHTLEGKPYYSQLFAMSSRFVTNKGLIKIRGKNIDFVQVLQRG